MICFFSKETFENEQDAIDFCHDHNGELDTEFNASLLAISGAGTHDKVIDKLISFDFLEVSLSGVVSWAGKRNNTVFMMYDGYGAAVEEVPIAQINTDLKRIRDDKDAKLRLPALCLKY